MANTTIELGSEYEIFHTHEHGHDAHIEIKYTFCIEYVCCSHNTQNNIENWDYYFWNEKEKVVICHVPHVLRMVGWSGSGTNTR